MNSIKISESEPRKNPHGIDARKLYDSEHAMVTHITLKPGEKLKKHITPVDVFFYVLEGKGTVEIGEEFQEVEQDTLIDSPAKIPHCWYNSNETDLRVLVVKVPKPKESTKVL